MLEREAPLSLLALLLGCAPSEAPTPQVRAERTAAPLLAEDAEQSATPSETLALNELMASNDSVVMDERGDLDDWVELLNASDGALSLAGFSLSLSEADGPALALPARELAPGERVVLWLDGEPEEGDLHLPLTLDEDEGALVLWEGDAPVDAIAWEDLGSDRVLARFPDAAATWSASLRATPWNANPWDPGSELDPSVALFPDDEVLTLELWLPDASLEALQGDPYTYVEAGVGFQGAWLEPVGVRVKGQWGSYRTLDQKVALKVKIDEYVEGARLRGLEGLTLNNMVQDPSAVHERLAYTIFRDAGVPAPRTAHVALWLNGEYRGLYNHVETMDDQLLSRWFEDSEGNLYEGAYGQDLSAGSYASLELDQDGEDDVEPYRELADLAALLAEEPTEERVAALEALVDLDTTLRMLAVEVITGHWDGYFYYPNNYRVYHDPSTGLLTLLPWGTDQTFGWTGSLDQPAGDLAAWALEIPSVRHRWQLALWDAADRARGLGLAEDATETWARVEPWLDADPYKEASIETGAAYVGSTISFLDTWPDEVAAELFPEGEPGWE